MAQQRADGTNPAAKHSPVEIDAKASVNDGLPVQRLVIGELRYQNLFQTTRSGNAAFDWAHWLRRLNDGVAAAACQLGRTWRVTRKHTCTYSSYASRS